MNTHPGDQNTRPERGATVRKKQSPMPANASRSPPTPGPRPFPVVTEGGQALPTAPSTSWDTIAESELTPEPGTDNARRVQNHHGASATVRGSSKCPLCGTMDSLPRDFLPVTDIAAEYRRQLSVEVGHEFPPKCEDLTLFECSNCRLGYFDPMVSGSHAFYEALSRSAVYYSQERWEFLQSMKRIAQSARLIDIGCGDGHFLKLLKNPDRQGLELNPEAIKRARSAGLSVSNVDISTLPDSSFDATTIFQVLEHVTDPYQLLGQLVRITRPKGKIFIAVPNNDGFIGSAFQEPLNLPPHHPLRWTRTALEHVPHLFPVRLEELLMEPVGREHLFLYRRQRIAVRIATAFIKGRVPLIRLNRATVTLRRIANLLSILSLRVNTRPPSPETPGHSYLAVFKRI